MAGGGTVTTGLEAPMLLPVMADESIMPAPDDAPAGGGTTMEGLMPGLPLSTVVTGSAPLAKSAAAFGSGGVAASAGLPGVIGLQMLDNPIMPNEGAEPAGAAGTIPLAASNAAVDGALVGDIARPGAGQAAIAPSAPICEGAARLPRLS
jgi:hypothetical protein